MFPCRLNKFRIKYIFTATIHQYNHSLTRSAFSSFPSHSIHNVAVHRVLLQGSLGSNKSRWKRFRVDIDLRYYSMKFFSHSLLTYEMFLFTKTFKKRQLRSEVESLDQVRNAVICFSEKLKADTWRDFVHVPPLSFTFSIFGLFMALLTRQLQDVFRSHAPPSELPAFDTCLRRPQ